MRQLITFIHKEFLHVLRDPKTLLMLFGLPIAQIVLFGFALSNEIKNSRIAVVDYSKDAVTTKLISKISGSPYFNIQRSLAGAEELQAAFKKGNIKMAVIFPVGFGDDLVHTGKATMQVIADASDPNQATTITNYLTQIVNDFNSGLAQDASQPMQIVPEVQMLYNPELRGAPN